MARKERKVAAEARLAGLLDAGDWRSARLDAEGLLATGDESTRGEAQAALVRLRPSPSAILAFWVGLGFLALVAAAGLWLR